MNDKFRLRGEVKFELFKDNKLVSIQKVHNTITNIGKQSIIAQTMGTPDKPKAGWIELGTSNPTSTKLGNYISGSRLPLVYTGRNGTELIMVVNYEEGLATGSITEAGVFNSATENGTEMLASSTFNAMNKSDLQSLLVTWKWIIQ